jgi:hypothetical protein
MGRKYFNLYDQIWQPTNLWQAFSLVARGKGCQRIFITDLAD